MTKLSLANGRSLKRHEIFRQEMADSVERLKRRSQDWMRNPRDVFGYPTGLANLDQLSGGMVEEEIVTIAGGTGEGKTALLTQTLEHVAFQIQQGKFPLVSENTIVFFLSLEMSRHAVYHRSAARLAGLDANEVRKGAITTAQYARYTKALDHLLGLPLLICDTPGLTSGDARDIVRLLQDEGFHLAVVGVDYVQLFADEGEGNSKYRVVMRNAITIKNEANASVALLSQYSRRKEWESTNGKGEPVDRPPRLSDLYESGVLEQSSDQVWMLHTPPLPLEVEYVWEGPFTTKKELYVRKNRNGPKGRIDLWYTPSLTQFTDPVAMSGWTARHLSRDLARNTRALVTS
jgi:replicative DNA helicase